jgi:hypothetical protein
VIGKGLIASSVPGTRGPLSTQGATGRDLGRLRVDQRRKRAGPILSGSSRAISDLGPCHRRAKPEMVRRSFAIIAALNAMHSVLGNICRGVRGDVYCGAIARAVRKDC